MAETSFDNTSYRGVQRAEVRVLTPDDPTSVTRSDPRSYSPLHVLAPGELPRGEAPPESTPVAPPTEAQLRDLLEQAITAKAFADENLARAKATHERAIAYRIELEQRLRCFDDLDARITQATIEHLQSGTGRPKHDDDPLRREITERSIVRDDHAAAIRAESLLTEAFVEAQNEVMLATRAANIAATAIVMLYAEAMAQRAIDMEQQAADLRELIAGFNTIHNATSLTLPPGVREIFGTGSRFLRPVPGETWVAARAALLLDPHVELTLENVT